MANPVICSSRILTEYTFYIPGASDKLLKTISVHLSNKYKGFTVLAEDAHIKWKHDLYSDNSLEDRNVMKAFIDGYLWGMAAPGKET